MKATRALLIGSLALNALVLAAIVFRPAASREFFRDILRSSPAPEIVSPPTSALSPVSRSSNYGLRWDDLKDGDFSTLSVQLRNAGFPPSMIRFIVTAAVNDHYAARRAALLPKRTEPVEYWRNRRIQPPASAETRDAMRAIDREQHRLLQDLLGIDYSQREADEIVAARRQRRYGDLSSATIIQLERIMSDYAELTAKVMEDSLNIMMPEDHAKLAFLEREKRADLERLLTPAGLMEYELRTSPSASYVLNRIGQFEASEEEFRALYAVRKAFDEEFSPAGGQISPDLARRRSLAESEMEEQFRQTLGEARYLEYKRANQLGITGESGRMGVSPDMIDRIVERLKLPPATTATVMAVQQDVQRQVDGIYSNRSLTSEQRRVQLAAISNEATMKLKTALGESGLMAYQRHGGQWLNNILRP